MTAERDFSKSCINRLNRNAFFPKKLGMLAAMAAAVAVPASAQSYLIPGVISTVAGSSTPTYFADGNAAPSTQIFPDTIALDGAGNIYIADPSHCVIHRVDAGTGVITVAAGVENSCGNGADAQLATATQLGGPQGVALDAAGNLYIADSGNGLVRKVDANTQVTTIIAGNGIGAPSASGLAINSALAYPVGLAVSSTGDVYISQNFVVSKVDHLTGNISTFAGTPGVPGYTGDSGLATLATLTLPFQLALDSAGDLYIADYGANVVREVKTDGNIYTVAGTGVAGYSGDGSWATWAQLNQPYGVAVDGAGNVYIADSANNVIREVKSSGLISTVAGTGHAGFGGNGGPAMFAWLNLPKGLALNGAGDLYLADYSNQQVRKILATPAGTKTPPQISTGQVNFGDQTAGTTSNYWTINISNTVGTPLNIYSILLTDPADFVLQNNCGSVLAGFSSCSVQVSFKPQAATGYTGLLYIVSDATHSPQTVTLTGTGTSSSPTVLVAPSTIDFGTQEAGTTGNYWTVTLNNTSGTGLNISNIQLSDATNFTFQDFCGTFLAAHSTCTEHVSFTPQSAGTFTGTLTFTDDASTNGGTQSVSLTGTGTTATPVIYLAPSTIDFGNQAVGTTSNAWTVTVNNESGQTIPLTGITLSDTTNFHLTDGCGTTLWPHSTCNLQISFSPQSAGLLNASITVQPVSGAPEQVFLSGMGTQTTPSLLISPGSINFGTQQVNTTSNAWTVTINNTSDVNVDLTSITSINPFFSQTNNCGTTVWAHTTCNMQVTFTPNFATAFTGDILIQTASYGLYVLPLSGQGTSTPNSVLVSPTTIAFGNQQVNTTSNTWQVNVSNTGNNPVSILQLISVTPYFPETNNCGSTLAAFSTCSIQVSFAPPFATSLIGQLVIVTQDSLLDPPQVQIVSLSGTGTSAPNAVTVSPTSIDFGNQPLYTTSNPWTVTVNNTGNTVENVQQIVSTNPTFAIANNSCGSSLAGNTTCTLQVNFTPTALGPNTGQIIVVTQDTLLDPPQVLTISLAGTGTNSTMAATLSPTNIDFGGVNLGTTTNPWTMVLSNPNDSPINVAGPTILGAGFQTTSYCGLQLAAHASCNVLVSFQPTAVGTVTGSVSFAIQYTLGGNVVSSGIVSTTLSATGVMPAQGVSFSPTSIDFGTLTTGQSGNNWTVNLSNSSGAPVNISALTLSNGTDFQESDGCPATLPAYGSCTAVVKFTPHSTGTLNGTLSVTVSSIGYVNVTTQTVSLTGKGSPTPDYTLTVNPQVLTLTAGQTGTATFTFTPVGGYQGTVYFSCGNLPPGVYCTFNPPSVTANGNDQVQTSTLTVTTSAPVNNPVTLGGIALLPGIALGALVAWRRKKLMPRMRLLLMLIATVCVLGGASGCGSGFAGSATPTGSYHMTVTANAGASSGTTSGSTGSTGSSTHTANFTLIIN